MAEPSADHRLPRRALFGGLALASTASVLALVACTAGSDEVPAAESAGAYDGPRYGVPVDPETSTAEEAEGDPAVAEPADTAIEAARLARVRGPRSAEPAAIGVAGEAAPLARARGSRASERSAPARRPARALAGGTGAEVLDPWGGPTQRGGGGVGPAAAPVAPLPQNAVLASTFVGGRGAQARLEDLLDRGVMVGGENLRLEAFDELGRLPYAVPSQEAVGLHAELERARLLEGGERVHLQIALMARQGEAPPRPRMDVRLVLDRSGSMMGEKWTHAIAAAHELVGRLQPNDTFGLVSYSDAASVDLAPARVGDRSRAHRAIDTLQPGGGTNIEAGLAAARQSAPRRRGPSDVLLVVLVSDGVATIGQTNAQALGAMARTLFDETGTLTTSVGLGTDFDEATMLAIAREGSGSYHFVRRAGDIGDILTDELEERAQAVAQALRLRIELADGVVATRVYGSRVLDEQEEARVRRTEIATDRRLAEELGIARDRQNDEDRGLRIHVPTFRRGDQHVVLMELEVPPGTRTDRIARVSLDYKDLLSGRNRDARVDVEAARTSDRQAAIASTRRPVKRTVLAFQAGDTLRGASAALERGDVIAARQLLEERQRVLVAAAELWHDPALARDADLLGRYDRVLSHAWDGWDSGSRRTLMMAMSFYGDRRMR